MTAPTSRSHTGTRALEGNGALLVREIALAGRIQRGLENLYRLDRAADVDDFVAHAGVGQREGLLVRETSDGLELRLHLPKLGDTGEELDPICQIIEGVSHFVYLADRASRDRETTQLELELQAEVDKYVILAASLESFDERRSRRLRERLYEDVTYVHTEDTIEGERYRVANERARRFTGRLEREFIARARYGELRDELRRFFHMSQGDKLRAA
ncbi:MAG TPA: hypothetical protein VM925_23115 [Labilithrix sp.]|nr:hypothetical protein [Labilithrix sp.]